MDNNKKFWQRAAKFYSLFLKNNKPYQDSFKKFSQLLAPYLNKNMRVLEIGCGIGQLSYLLADSVAHFVATDFSEEMIKVCNKQSKPNLTFKVEDGGNLSFDDDSFQCVIIANVLHIVPNANQIIGEVKRVLQDDGIIFAPIFIDTSQKFNLTVWFMERLGFKTYQNKSEPEYIAFLEAAGLEIIYQDTIKSAPNDEFVVICKKKSPGGLTV